MRRDLENYDLDLPQIARLFASASRKWDISGVTELASTNAWQSTGELNQKATIKNPPTRIRSAPRRLRERCRSESERFACDRGLQILLYEASCPLRKAYRVLQDLAYSESAFAIHRSPRNDSQQAYNENTKPTLSTGQSD